MNCNYADSIKIVSYEITTKKEETLAHRLNARVESPIYLLLVLKKSVCNKKYNIKIQNIMNIAKPTCNVLSNNALHISFNKNCYYKL